MAKDSARGANEDSVSLDWQEGATEDEGEVDVAIVGGGLSGLALAVGLQERGIPFAVFEKAAVLRTDSATAISLAINGLRAVEGLKPGLSEQMVALGGQPEHVYTVIRHNNGLDIRVPVSHRDGELTMLAWKLSQQLLASTVHPCNIRCNRKFLRYRSVPGGVESQFLVRHEGGSSSVHTVRSKLLVGCDGVWSGVRHATLGDAPRYLNFMNWNALVYNPHGKLFQFPANEVHMIHHESEKVLAYFSDVGHGYVLWLLRVLDEDGSLAEDHLRNCSNGFDKGDTKTRALQQLDKLQGWKDLRSAIVATDKDLIYERRSMDRVFPEKWSACDGRVLLIGDAAHGMYSALGMGARTAFEDSHQLTLALERAFKSSDWGASIPEAVERFEALRVPRLRRIHAYATELTEQPELQPGWTSLLSKQQKARRLDEFIEWTSQYPENSSGDPTATYWK